MRYCRSRKGAWIEIRAFWSFNKIKECRSRKGAWIEIKYRRDEGIDDVSRSRKGAWIEIVQRGNPVLIQSVAPVRERGLKCKNANGAIRVRKSLP